jgi:RNA polymerase sigma-70 factor (ECF subfamily)
VSGRSGAIRRKAIPSARPRLETGELFHVYASFTWRVLRRLGIADAEVDDVCQEVFVVAHRRLGDFEGRSSLQTWLYGICIRVAADHRKRARVRREDLEATPRELAIEARQEEDVALRQARAELDRILDTLSDDKRAVFVLYEIEELPMAEVAAAVGCPLQTAYSRLHAARQEVEAIMMRRRTRTGAP